MTTTDRRMAQVVAEMTVISEAGAAQLGDLIHGGEKNQAPKGPRESMAEEHARAYEAAPGPVSRREALREAEDALIRARLSPRRQFVPGTLEWRVAIARAEGSIEEVSIVYGCSRSTVYRLREQFGAGSLRADG